jgi:hypothetical protein
MLLEELKPRPVSTFVHQLVMTIGHCLDISEGITRDAFGDIAEVGFAREHDTFVREDGLLSYHITLPRPKIESGVDRAHLQDLIDLCNRSISRQLERELRANLPTGWELVEFKVAAGYLHETYASQGWAVFTMRQTRAINTISELHRMHQAVIRVLEAEFPRS